VLEVVCGSADEEVHLLFAVIDLRVERLAAEHLRCLRL
jgi:hypothetical protein